MTDSHIVQLVTFKGNERCLADPTLFKDVRDTTKGLCGKGLTTQFWGQTVERPHRFYWYLLWGSEPAHDAFQSSSQRTAVFSQLLTLAEDTPDERVMSYPRSPLVALQAPITETSTFDIAEGISQAVADAKIQSLLHVVRHLDYLWSFAKETNGKGLRGGYLTGWDSIESHMKLGEGVEGLVEAMEEVMPFFANMTIVHLRLQRHE